MPHVLHTFETSSVLAETLAEEVGHQLDQAISAHGSATLAVSGGSTPVAFFKKLAQQEIAWHSVTVMPVDERWVPIDHPRSNAKLVLDNLMTGRAAFAHLIPLYLDGEPEEALKTIEPALPNAFDVVILGMGIDGHTASFFPDATNLKEAVDPNASHKVSIIHAPSAGETRITLTLPMIQSARFLALHIEGQEKHKVLQKALETGPENALPIRYVLRQPSIETNIYWAP